MKNINGIELAKRIRKDNNRAEIIFITSHFEFVGEGYEVDALHYLLKPISADKLTQVLTKAAEKLSVESPAVGISCKGETVKLSMFYQTYEQKKVRDLANRASIATQMWNGFNHSPTLYIAVSKRLKIFWDTYFSVRLSLLQALGWFRY